MKTTKNAVGYILRRTEDTEMAHDVHFRLFSSLRAAKEALAEEYTEEMLRRCGTKPVINKDAIMLFLTSGNDHYSWEIIPAIPEDIEEEE